MTPRASSSSSRGPRARGRTAPRRPGEPPGPRSAARRPARRPAASRSSSAKREMPRPGRGGGRRCRPAGRDTDPRTINPLGVGLDLLPRPTRPAPAGARREKLAADLGAREAVLLEEHHAPPERGENGGGRRARPAPLRRRPRRRARDRSRAGRQEQPEREIRAAPGCPARPGAPREAPRPACRPGAPRRLHPRPRCAP